MKFFKKVLAAAAVTAVMASAAQAVNVGGVEWDPNASGTPADNDFTARFQFNQFFTRGIDAIANVNHATPDYSKAVNPNTVGLGDVLQGAGEVTTFNGVEYGNTKSTVGGDQVFGTFCNTCELTFTFGGFAINGPNTLTNGWLRLYVDDTPDFHISQTSGINAKDGQLFLLLKTKENVYAPKAGYSSGSLDNYFEIAGGIAAPYFDTNTLLSPGSFVSDLLSSASATFLDSYIAASTGQIKGNSVVPIPEPASLALLGLGFAGMAAFRRRKAVK